MSFAPPRRSPAAAAARSCLSARAATSLLEVLRPFGGRHGAGLSLAASQFCEPPACTGLRTRPGFFRPLHVLLLPPAGLVPSRRRPWGSAFRGLSRFSAGHLSAGLALLSLHRSNRSCDRVRRGLAGRSTGHLAAPCRSHGLPAMCAFSRVRRRGPCVSTRWDSRVVAENLCAFPGRCSSACRTRTSPGLLSLQGLTVMTWGWISPPLPSRSCRTAQAVAGASGSRSVFTAAGVGASNRSPSSVPSASPSWAFYPRTDA